jgi:hypothetical protein
MDKLDAFMPPAEVVEGVKRQMVNAGIDHTSIPVDWLVATIAAMNKWSRTPDGLKYVINSMGFTWTRGRDDRLYEVYNPQNGEVYPVPSAHVVFFSGVAVRGHPIDQTLLQSFDKINQQCDSCGIRAHCIKEFRDPSKDRLESLCNYCLSMDDLKRVKFGGDPSICEECTVTTCAHHPRMTSNHSKQRA